MFGVDVGADIVANIIVDISPLKSLIRSQWLKVITIGVHCKPTPLLGTAVLSQHNGFRNMNARERLS